MGQMGEGCRTRVKQSKQPECQGLGGESAAWSVRGTSVHLFVEGHLNGHWGLSSSVPLQHLRPLLASGPWVCYTTSPSLRVASLPI